MGKESIAVHMGVILEIFVSIHFKIDAGSTN